MQSLFQLLLSFEISPTELFTKAGAAGFQQVSTGSCLEKAKPLEANQCHPVPSTFPKHRQEVGGRKLKLHCQENPIPTVQKAGTALYFLRFMKPRDEKLIAGDSLYQLEQPQESSLQAQHVLNSGKCPPDRAAVANLEHRDLGEDTFLCYCHCYPLTHIQTVAFKNKSLSLEVFQKGGTRRTE